MQYAVSAGHAISIHAPREGSDMGDKPVPFPFQFISIHAPREGSDTDTMKLIKGGK